MELRKNKRKPSKFALKACVAGGWRAEIMGVPERKGESLTNLGKSEVKTTYSGWCVSS